MCACIGKLAAAQSDRRVEERYKFLSEYMYAADGIPRFTYRRNDSLNLQFVIEHRAPI